MRAALLWRALPRHDLRAAFALAYTATVLMLAEYFFSFAAIRRLDWVSGILPGHQDLAVGLAWVASLIVMFLAIPAAIVRIGHREPLSTIGWNTSGLVRHLRTYLLIYALALPIVLLAARRGDFLGTYPFVRSAGGDLMTLLIWECAYVLMFVALEAFFRGYLLFTLEARIGWLSVFVMTVPYTMIHFHKPWPEALAAIGAGLLLGALALRYRSFLGGAVLHAMVAVTMDLLSVHRAGLF